MSARVLSLHGFTQNADVLRSALQKSSLERNLSAVAQFHVLDAPHHAERPATVPESVEYSGRAWWKANTVEDDLWVYEGWAETVAALESFMEQNGPFDGVLGFSQGACCAATLAGMQERGLYFQNLPAVKFVILIGGFPSRDPALQLAYTNRIRCPSLHIIGEEDRMKEASRWLVDCFADPVVLDHPNGHVIPSLDESEIEKISDFITHALSQAKL